MTVAAHTVLLTLYTVAHVRLVTGLRTKLRAA